MKNILNSEPLVSIITVCLNSEKTIHRTIESVLNQTYYNFEYIIIDGKSTDKTLEIVAKYQNNYPGKINLISEKDNGIYDAMNKGIGMARGELIGMINSDDWYELDTIESVVDYFNKSNKDVIIYGLMRLFRAHKLWYIKSHNHLFLDEGMINHPTCFVAKSVYIKNGVFDLQYRYSSDYDFMLRLSRNKVEFVHIEKILANMDQGGISFDSFNGLKETLSILHRYEILSKWEYFIRMVEVYIKMVYKKVFGKKHRLS